MDKFYGALSKDGVGILANSKEEVKKIASMTAVEYLGPKPNILGQSLKLRSK